MDSSLRSIAPYLLLFFCSGAAALIYEILWLKELGRLFGVTAYAAACTLAAFFMGISAGSWWWGKWIEKIKHPLRVYAYLELAIALAALLYFALYAAYIHLYAALAGIVQQSPFLMLLIKFTLALFILFPPAFFMGGTLPVMGHFVVRQRSDLGQRVALLYLINTIGAVTGVLLAGFVLSPLFGFRVTYYFALATSLSVASIAWHLSQRTTASVETAPAPADVPTVRKDVPWRECLGLAFLSGLLTLALEVLWTRMFEQVLQNSVYTFSSVLAVFLVALALGAWVAKRLCRTSWSHRAVLVVVMLVSALTIALTPLCFDRLTGGMHELGAGATWSSYVFIVFMKTLGILLVPTVCMGTLFPYLMKVAEHNEQHAGKLIGRLAGINNVAAISGSLLAGFVLLGTLGLWKSIFLIALLYAVAALYMALAAGQRHGVFVTACLCGVASVLLLAAFGTFPLVQIDAVKGERLLKTYEGSHSTVTVIQRDTDLRLKENNGHLVGTSQSAPNLRLQSWVPLCAHGHPRSVFYLGMGTGITAGGALDFPVESVAVTELNPLIIRADREWFAPFTNQLFTDRRVRIVQDDGRNNLLANPATYDVIIADIFLTHHAGIANLYSLEHYQTVRSRLRDGGLCCQWLPLFEMSEEEFYIVARTMLEVFPQVTLWRRGFSPSYPVYGLIAAGAQQALNAQAFEQNVAILDSSRALSERIWFQEIPYAAYVANITLLKEDITAYPLNTDDLPVIEYIAPVVERNRLSNAAQPVLAWKDLGIFLDSLAARCPLERDNVVAAIPIAKQREIAAGRAYYHYTVAQALNEQNEAARWLAEYERWLKQE